MLLGGLYVSACFSCNKTESKRIALVSSTLFGDNIVTAHATATKKKKKKKKKALRARIGDLAIVRFDDGKTVGLVMECDSGHGRCYRVMQWTKNGSRTEVHYRWVEASRLTRCGPIDIWYGALSELTLDVVEPILEGEG